MAYTTIHVNYNARTAKLIHDLELIFNWVDCEQLVNIGRGLKWEKWRTRNSCNNCVRRQIVRDVFACISKTETGCQDMQFQPSPPPPQTLHKKRVLMIVKN